MLTAAIVAGVMHNLPTDTFGTGAADGSGYVEHIADNLPKHIGEGVVSGTVSGAVDTAINGGDLGENILGHMQDKVVHSIGKDIATQIGIAARKGDLNLAAKYVAHAALGGAIDVGLGGDGASGAVGALVGEASGTLFASELEECLKSGSLSAEQLDSWKEIGVANSKLLAGLVALVAGLDANMAMDTAENAVRNNAFSLLKAIVTRMVLGREVTPEEKAKDGIMLKLAGCAYDDLCSGAGDYKKVSQDEFKSLGLSSLVDEPSGLASSLYYSESANKYVLAFRGTEGANRKDWGADIAQAFGFGGDQYDTVAIHKFGALKQAALAKGADLVVVGHSLGGGLATLAASSGVFDRAVVFNPAGINRIAAKLRWDMDAEKAQDVTTAYVSTGDVLALTEAALGGPFISSLGKKVYVADGGWHLLEDLDNKFQKME